MSISDPKIYLKGSVIHKGITDKAQAKRIKRAKNDLPYRLESVVQKKDKHRPDASLDAIINAPKAIYAIYVS